MLSKPSCDKSLDIIVFSGWRQSIRLTLCKILILRMKSKFLTLTPAIPGESRFRDITRRFTCFEIYFFGHVFQRVILVICRTFSHPGGTSTWEQLLRKLCEAKITYRPLWTARSYSTAFLT